MDFQAICLFAFAILGCFSETKQGAAHHGKCMPGKNQIEIGVKCFKEVTGANLPEDSSEIEKAFEDEDMKSKLITCVLMEAKVVDENKSFNLENAEKFIQEMAADDKIKEELVKVTRDCASQFNEQTEISKIHECMEENMKPICEVED